MYISVAANYILTYSDDENLAALIYPGTPIPNYRRNCHASGRRDALLTFRKGNAVRKRLSTLRSRGIRYVNSRMCQIDYIVISRSFQREMYFGRPRSWLTGDPV